MDFEDFEAALDKALDLFKNSSQKVIVWAETPGGESKFLWSVDKNSADLTQLILDNKDIIVVGRASVGTVGWKSEEKLTDFTKKVDFMDMLSGLKKEHIMKLVNGEPIIQVPLTNKPFSPKKGYVRKEVLETDKGFLTFNSILEKNGIRQS